MRRQFNVLKGDMAVVGPRPERPVKNFRSNAAYETRYYYKTGTYRLGTVNYSYGASIDDSLIKLQYDLVSTQKLYLI
jgi:lipopolysaccharide/colanic/teichoic acid biosynthesis glycosyltransferase